MISEWFQEERAAEEVRAQMEVGTRDAGKLARLEKIFAYVAERVHVLMLLALLPRACPLALAAHLLCHHAAFAPRHAPIVEASLPVARAPHSASSPSPPLLPCSHAPLLTFATRSPPSNPFHKPARCPHHHHVFPSTHQFPSPLVPSLPPPPACLFVHICTQGGAGRRFTSPAEAVCQPRGPAGRKVPGAGSPAWNGGGPTVVLIGRTLLYQECVCVLDARRRARGVACVV